MKPKTSPVSPAMIADFLEAYPINVVTYAESLLVSNLEVNFCLDFRPFRVDGVEQTPEEFILNFAGDDISILDDWLLHVERFEEPETEVEMDLAAAA